MGFHLEGASGLGGSGIEEHAGEAGLVESGFDPEVRGKEREGAFEVLGIKEERPALVAGGDGFAGGGGFGFREREGEVAIAEEFAAGALLEVEAIGGPEDPGT